MAVVIDLNSLPFFSGCLSTLKEISKDSEHNEYMTDSDLPAFNFDEIKKKYVNAIPLSYKVASSVDGFMECYNQVFLIEFKNGGDKKHKSKIAQNIKDKVRDSLLIFGDLANMRISEIRQSFIFILVYDSQKIDGYFSDLDRELQDSSSREKLIHYAMGLGRSELIGFDLTRFQGLYFKEVHTYTKAEFENYLQKLTEREHHEQDSH